jgi:hypothetical protein
MTSPKRPGSIVPETRPILPTIRWSATLTPSDLRL